MAIDNIKLFNGQGRLLQLALDNNIYTTTMHAPKVSTGLSEVLQIFILESCVETVGGRVVETLATPFSNTNPIKVQVQGDPAFSLFSVYVENDTPFISTALTDVLSFDKTAILDVSINANGLSGIVTPSQTPLAVHLVYSPTEEGPAYGTVTLTAQNFTIIIDLYGEAENEDVRFSSMLENFGRSFSHHDELILRESDISEGLSDWTRVNQKRKELLLSGDEIYSNIGSVKGLTNALKFFGYQDLVVKEFWLNVRKNDVDNGKLISNELGLDYRMIEAGGFKKTDRIGLFYHINKVTGFYDEFDLPIVVDDSMFTPEEVLIKLFALKEKLRKDFLPPYVRITDITGEGVYFAQYRINSWSDKNKHLEVVEGEDLKIDISQPVGFLQDLRRLVPAEYPQGSKLPVERYTDAGVVIYPNLVSPYSAGQNYSAAETPRLVESILLFSKLVRREYPFIGKENIYDGEELNIPVGFPVVLTCVVPQTLWGDLNGATYANFSPHFSWRNIDLRQHYEIEWNIKRVGGGYDFTFRGIAEYFMKLPHFIPLEGKFDIKCRLINMDNHSSLRLVESAITVYQKSLEIVAVTKYGEDIKTWKEFDITWAQAAGTFQCPARNDIQDLSFPHVLLDPHHYKNQDWQIFEKDALADYTSVDFYNSRLGHTVTWKNTDATWEEFNKVSFKETKFQSEYLGGFTIPVPTPGDVLTVGALGNHVFIASNIADIVLELNSSITEGIDRFNYFVHTDGVKGSAKIAGSYGWQFIRTQTPGNQAAYTQTWGAPNWLDHAMLKVIKRHPNVAAEDWFLDAPVSDIISGAAHTIQYWINRGVISAKDGRGSMPSFAGSSSWGDNGLKIYNAQFKAPRQVPIFLMIDSSEVYGKHDILWNIKKVLDDGEEVDYMTVVGGSYVVLRLKDITTYTVEVELSDANNNRVKKRMPGFIQIIKG